MKAKLHKMVSGYILSLNGDIDDPYAIVNEELAKDYEWHKLSLKNCQTIERGYDLEDLADNYGLFISVKTHRKVNDEDFIAGFETALELIGDDLFNWLEKKGYLSDDKNILKKEYNQQTEWDVEVLTDIISDEGFPVYHKIKLDADGCLILKRI